MDKVSADLRSENRYVLGPQDKKRCRKCEQVYDGIKANFHIHKKLKTGTIQYASICKSCQSERGKAHKDKLCESIDTYAPFILVHLKHRAKADGLDFNLTEQHLIDMWNQQEGNCFYTGLPMDLLARSENRSHPHRNFPSVDKKIPNLGYVDGNVVWTLYSVNRMKNDFDTDQFIQFCHTISQRFT